MWDVFAEGEWRADLELFGEAPGQQLAQPAVVQDGDFELVEVPLADVVLVEQLQELFYLVKWVKSHELSVDFFTDDFVGIALLHYFLQGEHTQID